MSRRVRRIASTDNVASCSVFVRDAIYFIILPLHPSLSITTLQHLRIRRLTEPHEQRLADTQRRCLQVPCRPQHRGGEGVVVRRRAHVERDDLLAPGDEDRGDRARQLEGGVPALANLRRVGGLADRPAVLLEELPRFRAAGSALAVVHPVDQMGHGVSFWKEAGHSGRRTPFWLAAT